MRILHWLQRVIVLSVVAVFFINVLPTEGANNSLEGFVMIRDIEGLQAMADDPSGKYALANNIDAGSTATWNDGEGFVPVGAFSGVLDGQGYVIFGLTIDQPSKRNVGLFEKIAADGVVRNVGLADVNIVGGTYVGALAGVNEGVVERTYSTGSVVGEGTHTGGLLGRNDGEVKQSASAANVTSGSSGRAGGLVGYNPGGVIVGSYSHGTVNSPGDYIGGLVSENTGSGKIVQSFSTATVTGKNYVGGLVGANSGNSVVQESYSAGVVTGRGDLGGLVGLHRTGAMVKWSYSVATVKGEGSVRTGGLIGGIRNAETEVIQSYSAGEVVQQDPNTPNKPGGLVGHSAGSVSLSYWNTDTSGQDSSAGGIGLATDDMKNRGFWELLSGWDEIIDFGDGGADKVWVLGEDDEAPRIKALLEPVKFF